MLAEPVPLEERRAMARRLAEPVWKVVLEKGDDRTKSDALLALVNVDPRGVLEKLESARFVNKSLEFRIQAAVAAGARRDRYRRSICGRRVDRRPRRTSRELDGGG